jgi:hypothetical protein
LKKIGTFTRWARRQSRRRGILCHFYIAQRGKETSQKQYYDKLDYAHFNLLCDSRDWLVKGTPDHGISSARGKRSQVPCLNAFQVDDEFYRSLRELVKDGNDKFALGLLLNKRKLKNLFEVIDVSTDRPRQLPPPNECHRYDCGPFRQGVLNPFNRCQVVRVEIPKSPLAGAPIVALPRNCVLGLLVRQADRRAVSQSLRQKGLGEVGVFGLL